MISYCVFNVGDRRIGIPMSEVREIVERQTIAPTALPLAPPYVHGLFNLRGQVLPFIDLASFVGAQNVSTNAGKTDRAVIVERGGLRFATIGQRIDTVEADPETFTPLTDAALFPALDAQAQSERGNFQTVHLDRLEACLGQASNFPETI